MSGKLAVDLGFNPFSLGRLDRKGWKDSALESPPLFFFFSASVRRRTGRTARSLSLPSCSLDDNQCFEIEHADTGPLANVPLLSRGAAVPAS